LQPREPVRGDGGPGSAWYVTLDDDPVPCQRLTFTVDGPPVDRPFRVELANPNEPRQDLGPGTWNWRVAAGKNLLEIDLPSEVFARRLRLVVTDFANPPLNLQDARYTAAVRLVVFPAPSGKPYPSPLRLYFGNPQASPANYDFARRLPEVVDPPPTRLTLGNRVANPAYEPPPQSLPERMPWLVYALLATACVILLLLLALLARTTMRRHDQAQAATRTG